AVRVEMVGDEIERLMTLRPLTGEVISEDDELYIFPATHYVAGPERMERAIAGIEAELAERLAELERTGKLLEAPRLRMRTTYDIEMLRQVGSCSGIENYSRHIDGREPGSPPNTLLDYFPEDFLLVVDESHNTVPQIGAMYEGDVSRKRVLVEHGFRLPSAIDNRPLTWEEFGDRTPKRPGAAPARSPITPRGASIRSRCASGSRTSWTSWPARTPTPRSSSADQDGSRAAARRRGPACRREPGQQRPVLAPGSWSRGLAAGRRARTWSR